MTTGEDRAARRLAERVGGALPLGGGARPTRREAAATLGVLVVMLATASLRTGAFAVPDATLLAFSIAAWVPLLVRTSRPLVALAGTVLLESLHLALLPIVAPVAATTVMGSYQPVPLATAVAAFTVASRAPRSVRWGPGVASGGLLLLVSVVAHPLSLLWTDLVIVELVVMGTAVGALVANRHERIARDARDRDDAMARAVLDERLRIARELHDVLAHNLTLVNAQAAVADYLVRTDPHAAAEALHGLTQHTRRALDELRATVGLLREEGDGVGRVVADGDPALTPAPRLDRLDELLDGFRAAGTDVRLTVAGPRGELSSRGDLAAFRIVQEALTNATKHAAGVPVQVHLDWTVEELRIRVSNDRAAGVAAGQQGSGAGRATGHGTGHGSGHGLIGMRERALAAGGSLQVTRTGDGFAVSATLPAEPGPGPDDEPDGRAADGADDEPDGRAADGPAPTAGRTDP